MKEERLEKVGIQRELHPKWFDFAAGLAAADTRKLPARQEIYTYLENAPGFASPPTKQTRIYATNPLIKTWVAPDSDLAPLRDCALRLWQQDQDTALLLHWGLLSAAYPFWLRCAEVIGRLLDLQFQATQAQVVRRLKESYGDRQTVSRRARYTIRSFVRWGLLSDSGNHGVYKEPNRVSVSKELSAFLVECLLWGTPKDTVPLSGITNHPALYAFRLGPVLATDLNSDRVDAFTVGVDDKMLRLAGH